MHATLLCDSEEKTRKTSEREKRKIALLVSKWFTLKGVQYVLLHPCYEVSVAKGIPLPSTEKNDIFKHVICVGLDMQKQNMLLW